MDPRRRTGLRHGTTLPSTFPLAALAMFLAAGLAAGSVSAATYWVDQGHPDADDANPGTSESAPWLSMSHAVNNAVAGDTVWVKSGTYGACDDTVSVFPAFAARNNGTPANRIAFRVAPGHEGAVTLDCWVGGQGDYITWDGFRMVENSYQFSGGTTDLVEGIIVENCEIELLGIPIEPGNYFGIRFTFAGSPIVRNCRIHGAKYTNSTHHNATGIELYVTSDGLFEHNEIWDSNAGIYDKNSGEDNEIRYNLLHDLGSVGIRADDFGCSEPPGSGPDCGRQNIHHNIVDTTTIGSGISIGTGNVTQFDGVRIWNNTLYGTTEGITLALVPGVQIFNNIVQSSQYAMTFISDEAAVARSDFSLFASANAFIDERYQPGQTLYGTLAAWRSASGLDVNSFVQPALFVDAAGGDFHLQAGSPARGAGRAGGLPGGAAVDLGAYETGAETIGPLPSGLPECPDDDADGYVACGGCTVPLGKQCGECDDGDPALNPDAPEICNGADDDCDTLVDDDASGEDTDGDLVHNACDAFPADPARSGPMILDGLDSVDHLWQTIDLPGTYQDPVVITGAPSTHDPDLGVVQVDDVTGGSFDVRFAEWTYLDGTHDTGESFGFVVSEAGSTTMPDGSVWEFGTFTLSGTASFQTVAFAQAFAGRPTLILTVQSVGGFQPVTVRARNVTATSFQAALYEEEGWMDGHVTEKVGYLAVHHWRRSGQLTIGADPVPFLTGELQLDERVTPFLGWTLSLMEEQSRDAERGHLDEAVALLTLGRHLFAQDVSSLARDTVTVGRDDPESTVAMEWGVLDGVDHEWVRVPLVQTYVDPVVVASPASNRDNAPGFARVRNVTPESFEMRFQEWAYLDGVHGAERVSYIVADAGTHSLAGLAVEAGTLVTDVTLNARTWEPVVLSGSFTSAPGVLAAVQTDHDVIPANVRIDHRAAAGFDITTQEHEASPVDGRSAETVGWIALEIGSGTTPDGRHVELLTLTTDEVRRSVQFTPVPNHRFRTVVGGIVSTTGRDPVSLRSPALFKDAADFIVQEEQSKDGEMGHSLEDVVILVAQ